ncbi:hypothetical protein N9L68_05060 [bacterium]|nr:hypothetical protein [bacterium]
MPHSALGPRPPAKMQPWDGLGAADADPQDALGEADADPEMDSDTDLDEYIQDLREADGKFYEECTPEEASAEFCNLLVELKRSSETMTAKAACQLACWAARGGIHGPAHALGMQPDRQTGKCSIKFDRFVAAETTPTDGSLYRLKGISAFSRRQASRIDFDLPTNPPHEPLVEEIKAN